MKIVSLVLATALAGMFAAPASADLYKLTYTTQAGPVEGPAVTVDAILDATADLYVANYFDINSISGTRGAQPITGLDNNAVFQGFYYPATSTPFFTTYPSPTYVDDTGLTFIAGGNSFQLYRDSGDTSFYHEFETASSGNVGRLIPLNNLSITPYTAAVPLPSSWTLMLSALGLAAVALRSHRKASAAGISPA